MAAPRPEVSGTPSKRADSDTGPWGWENARAWRDGRPSLDALEIPCYTDLPRLTIRATSGPYMLMTPLPDYDLLYQRPPGSPRIGLVLRMEQHLSRDNRDEYLDPGWEQLDPAVYHGGNAAQELAALLSLALGIRLRAAGIARVFDPSGEDPRGHPHEFDDRMPYLPPPYGSPILPYTGYLRDAVDSSGVALLDAYADLSAAEARALVRAARAYQEALWIADGDPRQAWLRLVTAVEAVAQLAPDAPVAVRLKAAFPDIADRVSQAGDPVLLEWITKKFADQGRSTAKFRKFFQDYPSPRPPRRPAAASDRVNWTPKQLRKQLDFIYACRSKDLHEGVPFPQPMCQPPYRSPRGIAQEIADVPKSWKGDAPMLLHVFEYVVRIALRAWWRSVTHRPGVASGPNSPKR